MSMNTIVRMCGSLFLALGVFASSAWANPATIAVSCDIDHEQWPAFSRSQWQARSCRATLPPLSPYGTVEVVIAPITQSSHGVTWACEYATPRWVNAPQGFVVSPSTDGTTIRAVAVSLRDADSSAEELTIGVQCY